jgi:hypothetical protein
MIEWKPIPNYENLYEISSLGEIKSLYNKQSKILKQGIGSKGYKNITLCKNGKQTTFNVHRLVALVFLPNPNNLPCVNHKDENKLNNDASNLEWCSYYHNNVYGSRLTKSATKISVPVMCVETNKTYSSASAVQRETGICQSHISQCCNGKRKTAGGYHWKFV